MSVLIAAYLQIFASQRVNIAKRELQEVTDYVSQNLYDLIQTAVNFSSTDDIIWKQVNLPVSSNEKGYSISLSYVDGSISVSAWVDSEPFIRANSILPVNSPKANIKVYEKDDEVIGGVIVKDRLNSGSPLPVVWIMVKSDGIMIGLGWMKR